MRVRPHGANRDNIHLADTVSGPSISHGIRRMKKPLAVAAVALSFAPSCVLAQQRAGDAALGALSGAVVLGPVGAVAGAVIGFTAGPAISHSWGVRRSEPRPYAKPPQKTTSKPASSAQVIPPADPRRASAHEVSTPPIKPSTSSDDAKVPINGLEM